MVLGHKWLKGAAAICISIVVGVITNMLINLSGWKQALISMVLSVLVFFIHLHKVTRFVLSLLNMVYHVGCRLFYDGCMYLNTLIGSYIHSLLVRNTSSAANSGGMNNRIVTTRF